MKKTVLVLFTALCLLLTGVFSVTAAPARVVDEAGLLYSVEAEELETRLGQISSSYGIDAVVVTVDSVYGEDPEDYADDYYDYNGYGPDGILLLIALEESRWHISTKGSCIQAFTDAGLKQMEEQLVPLLSEGEFAQAFGRYADLCEDYMEMFLAGDPYDTHNLPKEPFSVFGSLLVSMVVGLLAAWIVTAIMTGKLKSVHQQVRADSYVVPGSMELTYSRDLHLYTTLNRRERPKSGGSSTHMSSSGSFHGGRGGKF